MEPENISERISSLVEKCERLLAAYTTFVQSLRGRRQQLDDHVKFATESAEFCKSY